MESNTMHNNYQFVEITNDEFETFSRFIFDRSGIHLPSTKKSLLTSRLNRRLHKLGISSFGEYYDFLHNDPGGDEEIIKMIDEISTNKTDFFREDQHFSFLAKRALPDLCPEKNGLSNNVRIWCAGCSTGEEPYTIAIICAEYFGRGFMPCFSILATDISTKVLKKAVNAIYDDLSIEAVPVRYQKKYFMKGKDKWEGSYRVVPEIRRQVSFKRHNLMDGIPDSLGSIDIIFCRNVIIYFNRKTQIDIFKMFYDVLKPGGYLFVGHSESLHRLNNDFVMIEPTVYRKPA